MAINLPGAASRAQFGGNVPTDASAAASFIGPTILATRERRAYPEPAWTLFFPPLHAGHFYAARLRRSSMTSLLGKFRATVVKFKAWCSRTSTATAAQDTGEPGLGNRVLFADLNSNGIIDPGEPVTTTAANGNASQSISNLCRDGLQSASGQAQTGESLSLPSGGHYSLTITPSSTFANQNFGVTSATAGQVTGLVFQDANANGVFDIGENTLAKAERSSRTSTATACSIPASLLPQPPPTAPGSLTLQQQAAPCTR